MSNDDKNKSDFDKLFDELFKDTNKKDDISAKKDDVLDDDILNEFLNMNSDKGDTINHVVDQETNINDDKQPKEPLISLLKFPTPAYAVVVVYTF